MPDLILNQGVPPEDRPEGLDFKPATMPPEYYDPAGLMALDPSVTREQAEEMAARNRNEKVFRSRDWQVHALPVKGQDGWPDMIHLNARRADREANHDWRTLQFIKNIIVGPEHEAVELYPAESRLTDTANNYHLWVLANPKARFPFGFSGRAVWTPEEAAKLGAKQR